MDNDYVIAMLYIYIYIYVIVKALPRVCTGNTARGVCVER